MSVLEWGKPPKAMSSAQWAAISADGAPPGVYTPNMSQEWAQKWKARMTGQRGGGNGLKVEVRKTAGAQVLLVIHEDGWVQLSANGQSSFSPQDWQDLSAVAAEARQAMREHRVKEKGKRQ